MSFKFENGQIIRDKISGFEGTIVAKVEYLNGLKNYLIIAKAKTEMSKPESDWIAENQLELIN